MHIVNHGALKLNGLIRLTACLISSLVASLVSHSLCFSNIFVKRNSILGRQFAIIFKPLVEFLHENLHNIIYGPPDHIPYSSMVFHIWFFPFPDCSHSLKIFCSCLQIRTNLMYTLGPVDFLLHGIVLNLFVDIPFSCTHEELFLRVNISCI